MKDSLVICCKDIDLQTDSEVAWFLFDSNHQMTEKGHSILSSLHQELSSYSSSYLITCLVPSDAVLLSSVNIPSSSARQIKQALPFMAEELLLEEIENVHLAQAPHINVVGQVELGIVSHSVLIHWLDVFHHCQLPPRAFIPHTLALPRVNSDWTVVVEDDMCSIRHGEFKGFCCAPDDLETLLAELMNQQACQRVTYHIDDDAWAERFISFECWQSGVELEALNYREALAEVLAVTVIQQGVNNLNLLQAGYAQQSSDAKGWDQWRLAAGVVAISLLLVLVSNLISGWYFQSQQEQINNQSVALYKRYFPNERRVISPRRQMASHLQNGGSQSEFLALVSQSSSSFNQMSSALNVEKLRYKSDQGKLLIELRSQSIENLDKLKQQLAEQGINATINSATEQGSFVMSRLELGGF